MKGGNFWVWYFFMYLFLPHKIFNFNLQVKNKWNFRNNWDDFLFDNHQSERIIINWRTFPNFWHHWWKEKFGRYEKMIVSLCQENMNFWDMIPITFCTVSDALFQMSGSFLLHKPLIRSFENLSGIDVVSVDNDPKFCQWSVTTSTFWSLYGLVLRWGYTIWSTLVD